MTTEHLWQPGWSPSIRAAARLRKNTQAPTPIAPKAKIARQPTRPPTMAPMFNGLLLSWPVGVLVGSVKTIGGEPEPEPVELLDAEIVDGTGASVSG